MDRDFVSLHFGLILSRELSFRGLPLSHGPTLLGVPSQRSDGHHKMVDFGLRKERRSPWSPAGCSRVALDMVVEPDAGAGLGHDRRECGLADFKRIAPQVVTVQFDEIEGVEEDALVGAVVTDEIERGNAVVIAGDSFAVDDAGPRAQAVAQHPQHSQRWRLTGKRLYRPIVFRSD
jgi:hypothetical protein